MFFSLCPSMILVKFFFTELRSLLAEKAALDKDWVYPLNIFLGTSFFSVNSKEGRDGGERNELN